MYTGKLVALQMMEADAYDPEQLGAKCDQCVLKTQRDGGPVGPELRQNSNLCIVAESPGEKEVEHGRPLVGPAGMELNEALKAVGVSRQMFNIHQAIACRPPENDLDKVMLKWQRNNKKREKEGLEPLPSPIECCRPRLINELSDAFGVLALGKTAYQSLTRKAKSILEIRGGPVVGYINAAGDFVDGDLPADQTGCSKVNILPTLHPSFVLRTRRWTRAFRSDLSRAHRWFTTGTLGWVEPEIVVNPSPSQLREFIKRTDIDYAVDVETTIDDPTVADLRTVGIGHEHSAMVVVLKSIETGSSAYRSDEDVAIRQILSDFFADLDRVKVAHNGGYFDRMVIKNHFGVDPKPMLDTILLHRSVESELPHKLAYVGSVYTDVSAWKAAHTATEAQSDKELAIYNGIDCVVTARAAPKLAEAVKMRGQEQVVQKDHRVQQMCVGLHENGMLVDRRARDEVARELLVKIQKYRQETQWASGRPDLNPNSVPQLRDLLFSDWKLQPIDYTKLGDPSTNDECVRGMRAAAKGDAKVVPFLDALRKYRRVAKEYGTYVRRLIPSGAPLDRAIGFQSEEEEEESERGLIMADGRVRPDYNAHGTTSGRLSSSNPNAQNWPKHLRKLIIPAPGNVIVGADADQLELRIITAIAQIQVYLEAFNDKRDPHAMTAALMFGKKFTDLQPKSDLWDKLRKIAKSIKYASFYGSGDETVHGLVTSAEDDNGNLMYPDLTLREVSALKRNWLKGIPELPRWWEDTMDEYRSAGYVIDPVWGRRRDFLDGEAFNEIVNHPVQSAGAHIIHESTFSLLEEIPFEKWGPGTGLISQVHDALYVECPESEASWVSKTIEKHMNRNVKGLDGVVFSAKAKAGKNWGEV